MIKSSEIIKIQVAFKFMRAVVQTLFTWLSLGPPSDAAAPVNMFNMCGEGALPAGVT